MANTGLKIVLTLKEVGIPGNIPTGNTKPNATGDPDYIAPYNDYAACPINSGYDCPSVAYQTDNSGSTVDIQYEFAIVNSVLNNATIAKLIVKAVNGSTVVDSNEFSFPRTNNYFSGILNVTPGTYSLNIEYVDSSNTVLATCTNPGITV